MSARRLDQREGRMKRATGRNDGRMKKKGGRNVQRACLIFAACAEQNRQAVLYLGVAADVAADPMQGMERMQD